MTAVEADVAKAMAVLVDRLAVAEETLRALRAGEVEAIVLGGGPGEPRIYVLESEDRPYRRLVEALSEGAALLDADGLLVYANQRLAALLEVSLERLIGLPFSTWLDEPERPVFSQRLAAATPGGHDEYTLRRLNGDRVPVLVGVSVVEEPGGLLRCLTVTDLSEQKARQLQVQLLNAELTDRLAELNAVNNNLQQAEHLLTHRTLHDPLTGLANRTLFLDRLQQSLADAVRSGHPSAVYFIDLDGFKKINDTLGHSAGDQLLRQVAARLSTVVRPGDTVARFAGDEFLVLASGTTGGLPVAAALADRLLDCLLDPPLQTGGETVTASIGLALSRDGVPPEDLLHEADAAMYHAKRAGRARWELYGSELRGALRRRRTSERGLRQALSGDGVRVLYQPVVDLANGRSVGAEALVRIQRDDGKLLTPDRFITEAEDTGLVLPLGQRVLDHATGQPLRWQDESGHPWFVSVNISPRQLSAADFGDEVTAALSGAGLPGNQLRLEVTESALLAIGPSVLAALHQLRGLGVRIGIDDFGTGYASLSYVRHLPLDFIKIDLSFVAGMQHDPHDLAMVEATLALSHRLGLQSVAEGIETKAQWELLRSLGCDEGQGFLFGRPTTSDLVCSQSALPLR